MLRYKIKTDHFLPDAFPITNEEFGWTWKEGAISYFMLNTGQLKMKMRSRVEQNIWKEVMQKEAHVRKLR
jgi:hypothetical protein